MAKLLKRLLALGVAAMLLFACAACNGNKPPEPTDPEISEEITTEPEPDTIDAASTEDEETTEPTTEEATPRTKPPPPRPPRARRRRRRRSWRITTKR